MSRQPLKKLAHSIAKRKGSRQNSLNCPCLSFFSQFISLPRFLMGICVCAGTLTVSTPAKCTLIWVKNIRAVDANGMGKTRRGRDYVSHTVYGSVLLDPKIWSFTWAFSARFTHPFHSCPHPLHIWVAFFYELPWSPVLPLS